MKAFLGLTSTCILLLVQKSTARVIPAIFNEKLKGTSREVVVVKRAANAKNIFFPLTEGALSPQEKVLNSIVSHGHGTGHFGSNRRNAQVHVNNKIDNNQKPVQQEADEKLKQANKDRSASQTNVGKEDSISSEDGKTSEENEIKGATAADKDRSLSNSPEGKLRPSNENRHAAAAGSGRDRSLSASPKDIHRTSDENEPTGATVAGRDRSLSISRENGPPGGEGAGRDRSLSTSPEGEDTTSGENEPNGTQGASSDRSLSTSPKEAHRISNETDPPGFAGAGRDRSLSTSRENGPSGAVGAGRNRSLSTSPEDGPPGTAGAGQDRSFMVDEYEGSRSSETRDPSEIYHSPQKYKQSFDQESSEQYQNINSRSQQNNFIKYNEVGETEEESEEIPVPWLEEETEEIPQPKKAQSNGSNKLNETFDPYHKFNSDDIYDFPELVPRSGNVSDLKWRDSHWKQDRVELGPHGSNITEGNWTKGFREIGHWAGPNDTEGIWLEEGLYKGIWSLTKHLGRSLMEIFWTKQFDAQLNITMKGNDSSNFVSGNWSEGNSTREVGLDFLPGEILRR